VAVVIRMKRMGRTHRAFFRICATDRKSPRDGRVIEELGTYDPSVPETDARCALKGDRVAYWLSVGAQPSPKVGVLIKKYGLNGTHLKQMEQARARLAMPRLIPEAGEPVFVPEEKAPEAPAEAVAEAPATETPAADAPAAEVAEAPAAEVAAAEAPAAEADAEKSE
jgi:small subunit ribosomal protein S16